MALTHNLQEVLRMIIGTLLDLFAIILESSSLFIGKIHSYFIQSQRGFELLEAL